MSAAVLASSGAILPFMHDFSSGWGEIAVSDGNGDGTKFILTQYMGYNYTQGVSYTAPAAGEADEWLFTPAFDLEAGLSYEISFKAKSNTSNTTNTLVLATGASADAAAMQPVDGATLTLPYGTAYSSHTYVYTPQQSGPTYFGFHLVSEAAQGTFYLDDIEISAGVNGSTPAEVTASAATYSVVDGKLNVAVTVTAPTQAFNGTALDGTLTLTATRSDDDTFSQTFETAPGRVWNFNDPDGVTSYVDYTFTAANAAGISAPVTVSSKPTVALPAAVTGLTVTTDGKGAFSLSWEPVTTGATTTGIFLPSAVTYTVSCNNSVIERGITATEFQYSYPMPEEGQETVVFSVLANNSQGAGSKTTSDIYLVGNPYVGEFAESGAYVNYRAAFDKKTWTIEGNASAWSASTGNSYSPVVNPQDEDGALISYNGRNGDATLLSPVLDLSGVENAMLKFYLYHYPNGTASTIQAGIRAEGTDTMLGDAIVYNDAAKEEGWHEYMVAIPAALTAAPVQIVFKGVSNNSYGSMFIDNISVKSYLADNIAVTALAVPKAAAIGAPVELCATVFNKGVNTASGYSVVFEIDGETVGTVTDTPELASQASATITLAITAHPRHGGSTVAVTASAVYAIDLDVADNTIDTELPVEANDFPLATDLKGSANVSGVTLTWTAPEVSAEPTVKAVTESFEDWTAYSTSVPEGSGWIFVDADEAGQYGFNGHNGNTKFAAMVGENYTPSYGNSFASHDGTKALIMTKPYSYSGSNDNWIISPELKGGATFSFWTSATHSWNTSTDNLEVYYSMGSTDTEEFLRIAKVEVKTWDWTQYSYTLPAAARRIAFRTNGTMNNDAIAIDEVVYSVEDAPLSHTGYNVYRNHEKIGSTDAATAEFFDEASPVARETRSYYVTALYDKGESMPSESIEVDMSTGIDNVAADHNGIAILAADGTITVTGAEGMAVVIADTTGRTVFATASAGATVSAKAAPGIYIVKAGTTTVKVIL